MKFSLALTLGILGSFLPLAAQNTHCGHDEAYHLRVQKDTAIESRRQLSEKAVEKFTSQPQTRTALYIIPVVFHVIHTNGEENISREQVLDQMRVINQDFNLKNNTSKIRTIFKGIETDCQIEFRLATIDPNGNCTDGINRVYSPLGNEVDQQTEEVKDLIRWDYRKYLNIWVVTSIKTTQVNGTILGYAVFPWEQSSTRDGIVIRHDRVGTIGTAVAADSGRTLTHEIGHWLGLYHPFGVSESCVDQDFCDDTPPVSRSGINQNCPANGNSCNTDNPDLPDLWEDYMDYSNGNCMALFTPDQKSRMHAFLNQFPRNQNVSSSNLLATGITLNGSSAPIAFFSASKRVVCAGEPVKFYDLSCRAAVTARSWTLTGSSIPSSTSASPEVVYQTPGKYQVSLTVQNGSGNNTRTVADYIEVIPKVALLKPNILEDFESGDPTNSKGFKALSPSGFRWKVSAAAYNGGGAYEAPVSSADPIGTVYSFQTPSFDLSTLNGQSPKFSFMCSYAQAVSGSSEILRVFISTDCGATFRQVLERKEAGLAYLGAPVSPGFVPSTKNQWRVQAVFLSAYDDVTNAIMRIDVVSNQGNKVYIDDINIATFLVGVENNTLEGATLKLFPNPTSDEAQLALTLVEPMQVNVALYDLSGRKVKDIFDGNLSAGNQQLKAVKGDLRPGMYEVRIATPKGIITKPLYFAP